MDPAGPPGHHHGRHPGRPGPPPGPYGPPPPPHMPHPPPHMQQQPPLGVNPAAAAAAAHQQHQAMAAAAAASGGGAVPRNAALAAMRPEDARKIVAGRINRAGKAHFVFPQNPTLTIMHCLTWTSS